MTLLRKLKRSKFYDYWLLWKVHLFGNLAWVLSEFDFIFGSLSMIWFSDVNYKDRLSVINSNDEIDAKYGFEKYTGAKERNAWLINVQPVSDVVLSECFRRWSPNLFEVVMVYELLYSSLERSCWRTNACNSLRRRFLLCRREWRSISSMFLYYLLDSI